jgi:hypothetical protein
LLVDDQVGGQLIQMLRRRHVVTQIGRKPRKIAGYRHGQNSASSPTRAPGDLGSSSPPTDAHRPDGVGQPGEQRGRQPLVKEDHRQTDQRDRPQGQPRRRHQQAPPGHPHKVVDGGQR